MWDWRRYRNLWFVIQEKRARKLHKLMCGRVNLRSVLPPRDTFTLGIGLAFEVPEQVPHQSLRSLACVVCR